MCIRDRYKSNPKLALVMMLAVFSLAGIPPVGGFFSKFFILAAAAAKGDYLLVLIALVNTVAVYYTHLTQLYALFFCKFCQFTEHFSELFVCGFYRLSFQGAVS